MNRLEASLDTITCVRTKKPGVGACVPPYFVYQLRLDGYPLMR